MKAPQGTFAIVPLAAALDDRLGKVAVRLIILMASYRNRDGEAWPAVETLACRLGVDRRAVQRALGELIACGHLIRSRRTMPGRGQTSSSFTIRYAGVETAEILARAGDETAVGESVLPMEKASGGQICPSASHAVKATAPAYPERSNLPPRPDTRGGKSEQAGAVILTAPGAVKMDNPGRSPVPPKEESNNTNEDRKEEEDALAREAAAASAPSTSHSDEDEAVLLFNDAATRVGWVCTQHLTSTVRKHLGKRLGEAGGLQGWRDALAKAEASTFLTAKMRPTLSLDWLVKEDHFASLMHGRYAPEHDPPVKKSETRRAIESLDAAIAAHHDRQTDTEGASSPPPTEPVNDVNANLATLSTIERRPHREVVELAFKWKDRLMNSGLGADAAREVVVAAVEEGVRTRNGIARIEELVDQRINFEGAVT